MFGHIKSFIASFAVDEHEQDGAGQRNNHVTITALLIRVATVHHEMTCARRARLHVVLKDNYSLDEAAAARLIEDADIVARTAIDLYRFTQPLNRALDGEGRRRVIQMMWDVVYADRGVNEFEQNIIWRAADLLGVSTRQRVELRRGVMASMDPNRIIA